MRAQQNNVMYFIYDGQCPLCATAAGAYRIRQSVGDLETIDARCETDHPALKATLTLGFNLDHGMVIHWNRQFYQGADALVIMALFGSRCGWYNRINATLFRSHRLATLLYPALRTTRNMLLKLKGIKPLKDTLP